jgi:deoxyribodipyrimidine photolyase-related protein
MARLMCELARPQEASLPTPRPARGADRVTVVLPWDLDARLSAFPRTPDEGQLLVLETRAKPDALPFHRQKLTLIVSALRHFVTEQRARGFHVEHRVADDWAAGVRDFARWAKPAQLHAMAPREWAVDRRFEALTQELPLTLHDDGGEGGHFLLTRAEFTEWAKGEKGLKLERFYAHVRTRLGVLLDAKGKPEGGRWSFDAENREHARGVTPPPIPFFTPDAQTQAVMRWVEKVGRFGQLEGFGWPVTRTQALSWLDDFITHRLPHFGRYEDAIRSDAPFLFHSLLSVPLNLGLLHPREVVEAAERAYRLGRVPLASAEGFIRQVLGWREFIRGVYWRSMPGLRSANQLEATRPLPDFFWHPERTQAQCLREALVAVEARGYTHHIERLMVLCNYATLAGLDPLEVSHWFWAAFVDAYEWVELPNVVGMGLFGTDAFTTKPYLSSAAYLKRQSGLSVKGRGPKAAREEAPCARCAFDPDLREGPQACPFNALYWDFLARHRERLSKNPRIAPILGGLDRLGDQLPRIRQTAQAHLEGLTPAEGWSFVDDAG